MTVQESITDLEKRIQRLKEIIENGEYGCVDIETFEKFTAQVERYELYLSSLREKLAREQGCDGCEWTARVGQEPCVVCLRGKVDCWQSNAPTPEGDAQ